PHSRLSQRRVAAIAATSHTHGGKPPRAVRPARMLPPLEDQKYIGDGKNDSWWQGGGQLRVEPAAGEPRDVAERLLHRHVRRRIACSQIGGGRTRHPSPRHGPKNRRNGANDGPCGQDVPTRSRSSGSKGEARGGNRRNEANATGHAPRVRAHGAGAGPG